MVERGRVNQLSFHEPKGISSFGWGGTYQQPAIFPSMLAT